MMGAILSWVLGSGWKWLALAAALAGALIWHQSLANQAIARAREAADIEWRQALAKQDAEAQIKLVTLQARADDAGEQATKSRAQIENLQRQIEADNGNLPKNDRECLDAGRARLLDRL